MPLFTTSKVSHSIKGALIAMPLIATSIATQAESFSAKRAGQGFTSITQDFTSSLSNPALLTKYDNDDDVFFSLNIGVMGSDKYEVISTTEDISDNLDDLVDDIDALQYQSFQTQDDADAYYDDLYQQVDDIVSDFEEINEKVVNVRNGLNFQILIPNEYLSFGVFVNQYARIGGSMKYVSDDEQTLIDSIDAGELDLKDLDSSTLAVGYSIAEVGVMAAYPIIEDESYNLSVGTKIKYQRIDLFYNDIAISDFDDDDFEIDDDEYITDSNATNADLGLYLGFGDENQWSVALVANNLIKQTVVHEDQNITFNLEPSAILGVSYQNDWVSIATELDLTDREYFASLEPTKYASIGAEFRIYEHLQLRAGYRTDLNDAEDDVYTAGIGISPWDVFAIDIAAFTGENDTIGAALQFSLKI